MVTSITPILEQNMPRAQARAGGRNTYSALGFCAYCDPTTSAAPLTKQTPARSEYTFTNCTGANLSNQQFSITSITNSTGAISERYAYSAYGQPTVLDASGSILNASAISNRYTYTGREWDATMGLHHFRARWVSPSAGRFLSRDPIGYLDGPDLYAYLGNNSLDSTDPTGLQDDCKPPTPNVTVNFTSKVHYKTEPWRRTIREFRNTPAGTPLGWTEFEFSSSSRFKLGAKPCANCMCEGGNSILLFLTAFELNIHLDINVTTVDWVNVPRSKQAEWDRLKQAILDHENQHVRDMQGVFNDAKKGKPKLGPMSREVCPKDFAEAKKELEEEIKAKEIELRDKVGNWISERYRKLRDQFHQTNPNINIRDYISE